MKKLILSCVCVLLLGSDAKSGIVGDQGRVTAVRHEKEVEVTIEGVDGWRLNVEYPPRLKMGDNKWGVDDMKWRGCKDGKADAGVWRVTTAAVSGEVKAVFCNSSSCSAPVSGTFSVK
jgi:hypothetical protein